MSKAGQSPQLEALLAAGAIGEALAMPIRTRSRRDRLRAMVGGTDFAFASLTFGDLLYDMSRIDPLVLESIDFARAADLSGVFSFAAFAQGQSELREAAFHGSLSQMHGYVAERIAAKHLMDAGHDVTLPASSSQPGWDLLVDGQPFQVKCVSSDQPITAHRSSNPDIPTIVNVERAKDVEGMDGVFVDPFLSVERVRTLTESTLQQGIEIGDFELPWISLIASSATELRRLASGSGDIEQLLLNVSSDVSGRIAGGAAGQWGGALLGSYLFGPAGVIVVGALGVVAGGISGARISRRALDALGTREAREAAAAAQMVGLEILEHYPEKRKAWDRKRALITSVETSDDASSEIARYVSGRIDDEIKYFDERVEELSDITKEGPSLHPAEYCRQVIELMRKLAIHPSKLQGSLQGLAAATRKWSGSPFS